MKRLILMMTFLVFMSLNSVGVLASNTPPKYGVATSSDGELIAYSTCGGGETALIFIHGWSLDSRLWQNQLGYFSPQYQVLTMDLAGHGNSSFNRKEYTMVAFANDIKAVVEKEQLDSVILIGHSMAGGVIAEAAKLMPKKVKSIIGVDTSQNVALAFAQSDLDAMTKPFEDDFQKGMSVFVKDSLPKDVNTELLHWVTQDMVSAPPAIAINQFRHYLGQYVSGKASQVYESVNVPVVLVNARLWPTNSEENKKHIKDYSIYYIEGSGHFPMLEKPNEFNTILMEAVKSVK
ncbi:MULTISPECIES: alpha/beta fold hydrolase [Photobacterium]|uniref:3-oxoadipate enol-lactonase n=1 Tax=Photobacterium sanguinicancri TaxID=875932 RepID=A0ABX4FRD7_9GAMM|nr:alpha/beta hydrolase [Photobacterium sanguinicancri]OZS41488.1 3-oxoadipate enol-lactonase [Photobacterium sanguinicancri]